MKNVEYTAHLRIRLKSRKIPEDYPQKIYDCPEQVFLDRIDGTKIAVRKLFYYGKTRNMMIAYEENNKETKIITIHPITDEKIISRCMRGRWIQYE